MQSIIQYTHTINPIVLKHKGHIYRSGNVVNVLPVYLRGSNYVKLYSSYKSPYNVSLFIYCVVRISNAHVFTNWDNGYLYQHWYTFLQVENEPDYP